MTFISSLLWTSFQFFAQLHEISSLGYKTHLGLLIKICFKTRCDSRQDNLDLFVPTPLFALEKRRPLKETFYSWQEEDELV